LSDTGSDGFRTLLKSDEAFIDVLLYKPLNEASEHYAVVAMKNGASGDRQFFDDIVTLSACETGLGRALSSQGVVGLRSAIIGAGAKSVLMSLWSVPDDATQELMKRFYSNLWKDGMIYIRQKPKWRDPANCAAWLLVGE